VSRALRFAVALLVAVIAAWAVQHAHMSRQRASESAAQVEAAHVVAAQIAAARVAAAHIPAATRAADPQADGGSESPPDAQFPALKIPEQLPDFTLENRDGKPTPIATWRGKSLVLNFWATWCAPCRREIPVLQALDAEWHARNVAVIGIAVDRRDEALAFAAQFHIAYPLLIGEQDALDAATAMGVASPALPFTVFTDRRGQIVAVFVGELHRPQADLILGAVKNLNDDRIALRAARRAIADGLDELKANKTG